MTSMGDEEYNFEILKERFEQHKLKYLSTEKYEQLYNMALSMALMVMDLCPPSLERSMSLLSIESCFLWAQDAISKMDKK